MADIWVTRFKAEALPAIRAAFKPERVIVFGSRVAGNARPDSDLDVIVVSSAFAGTRFLGRMARVLEVVRFPKHIDYLCYTPEEFARIQSTSSVVGDAMRNHLEVA
jgi:predicted nucleotidyltransferase